MENVSGCDLFFEENCEFEGVDTGLSPEDGAMRNEEECQEFCRVFQDIGCSYWIFEASQNTSVAASTPNT